MDVCPGGVLQSFQAPITQALGLQQFKLFEVFTNSIEECAMSCFLDDLCKSFSISDSCMGFSNGESFSFIDSSSYNHYVKVSYGCRSTEPLEDQACPLDGVTDAPACLDANELFCNFPGTSNVFQALCPNLCNSCRTSTTATSTTTTTTTTTTTPCEDKLAQCDDLAPVLCSSSNTVKLCPRSCGICATTTITETTTTTKTTKTATTTHTTSTITTATVTTVTATTMTHTSATKTSETKTVTTSETTTTTNQCDPASDIVFILDSSSSISVEPLGKNDTFDRITEFVAGVIQRISENIGFNQFRVSVINFATDVEIAFELLTHVDDPALMENIVLSLRNIGQEEFQNDVLTETQIHKALQSMRHDVLVYSKGYRDQLVPLNVILISDGQPLMFQDDAGALLAEELKHPLYDSHNVNLWSVSTVFNSNQEVTNSDTFIQIMPSSVHNKYNNLCICHPHYSHDCYRHFQHRFHDFQIINFANKHSKSSTSSTLTTLTSTSTSTHTLTSTTLSTSTYTSSSSSTVSFTSVTDSTVTYSTVTTQTETFTSTETTLSSSTISRTSTSSSVTQTTSSTTSSTVSSITSSTSNTRSTLTTKTTVTSSSTFSISSVTKSSVTSQTSSSTTLSETSTKSSITTTLVTTTSTSSTTTSQTTFTSSIATFEVVDMLQPSTHSQFGRTFESSAGALFLGNSGLLVGNPPQPNKEFVINLELVWG
eukprot:m.216301 g.216301  ORF g.216301 m.216301 type:complete len:712 (-) comp15878_c0_seq1:1724-3859(-)